MPAELGQPAKAPSAGCSLAAVGVACERGGRRLFEGLEVALAAGELLLIQGSNGSGKSSLLRILAGLLRPAAGRLLWRGQELRESALHHAELHLVSVGDPLKPALSGSENLRFLRDLLGGDGEVTAALGGLGAASFAAAPARYFSTGQRRRVALARLLAAPRPLWLLDEPEAGLDRAGRKLLVELVQLQREGGGIVVIASHDDALWQPSVAVSLGD